MKGSRRLSLTLLIFLAASTGSFAAAGQGQDVQEPPVAAEEQVAPVPESPPETVPETSVQDWQSELDAIADLLIDGKPAEARQRTAKLLETQNLPEAVAARARDLQQKADARLAAEPAPTVPRKKIEIPEKPSDSPKPSSGASFKVRLARVGSGFEAGTSGVLSVSETGLAFLRQGKPSSEWLIRWGDLAEAREDDGLWDVPYPPLVLIERGGRKHYVAPVDGKGLYQSGSSLLSAISEGRRKQKGPKSGPAGHEPEPSPQEQDP